MTILVYLCMIVAVTIIIIVIFTIITHLHFGNVNNNKKVFLQKENVRLKGNR